MDIQTMLKIIIALCVFQIILLILNMNKNDYTINEKFTNTDLMCIPDCQYDEDCVKYSDYDYSSYGTCRKKVGGRCWFDSQCAVNQACKQSYEEGMANAPGRCQNIGYSWKNVHNVI
jgi:hypothetical protein